jgi:hypothetical protein
MKTPRPFEGATGDQIQALFQALLDFMGTTFASANVNGFLDAAATTMSITATDKGGDTYTYSQRVIGPVVAITPASVSVKAGATQQFTAKVTDNGAEIPGAAVEWSATGPGAVAPTGLYTAPASVGPYGATDAVKAIYAASGSSAVAQVSITP